MENFKKSCIEALENEQTADAIRDMLIELAQTNPKAFKALKIEINEVEALASILSSPNEKEADKYGN